MEIMSDNYNPMPGIISKAYIISEREEEEFYRVFLPDMQLLL